MSKLVNAQPIYFGPQTLPLFGWLHHPLENARSPFGLVMCNPFGYEAICSHRTYKHMAERAVQLGIPALRFDYHGTGNSAGDPLDNQYANWLVNIDHAIDALKDLMKVESICLFGIRLGATLSMLAAQKRTDVSSIIAFAPIVNGKTYMRELRALALARSVPGAPPQRDPTVQEAAGFSISEQTRNELATVNLTLLSNRPAPRILIASRDDLPTDETLAARLVTLGTQVEQHYLTRYVELMQDAHNSVVPVTSIETALAWLNPQPAHTPPLADAHAWPSLSTVSAQSAIPINDHATIYETAQYFAGNHPIFGIVSSATNTRAGKSSRMQTVVVLLNSGAIHHIGPGRVYVTLARRCATQNITVIRIDLSGIGESPARPDAKSNDPYSNSALEDIRQIVEFIYQQAPTANIHLVGMCSGAYHGLKAALSNYKKPLRSITIINPLIFFWKEGTSLDYADFHITAEVNRYRQTALQLSAWLKLFRGDVNLINLATVLTKRLWAIKNNLLRDIGRRLSIPLKEDLATELRQIAGKDTDMFFVFSSTDPGLSMLHEQGGYIVAHLSKQSIIRIAVINGADHTFTGQAARDELIETLLSRLNSYV